MDTWVIVAVAGRSMFGGARGDNTAKRTGQETQNFSDDPPAAGPRR